MSSNSGSNNMSDTANVAAGSTVKTENDKAPKVIQVAVEDLADDVDVLIDVGGT